MLRENMIGVYITAVVAMAVIACVVIAPDTSAASFNMGIADGARSAKGVDHVVNLFGETGVFRTITNVMLYLIGAISVIMLIVGGLRYVISGGDSSAVQGAKNTILYAIVGVIVAILSYAAVSFVITSFSGSAGTVGTNV